MNRTEINQAVEQFYQARLSNDPAACAATFADQPTFSIPGIPGPAPEESMPPSLEEGIRSLIEAWRWQEIRDQRVLVDGSDVAVRYTLVTLFAPTGEQIVTEMMDHLVFDADGQVTSFTQFLDTALVRRLTRS